MSTSLNTVTTVKDQPTAINQFIIGMLIKIYHEMIVTADTLKLHREIADLKSELSLTRKALEYHWKLRPGKRAVIKPLNCRQGQSKGQQFGSPLKVELPTEIWMNILSRLDLNDLRQCRQVSTGLNEITTHVTESRTESNNHWLFNRITSYSEITSKERKFWLGTQIQKKLDATPLRCSKMGLFMKKSHSLMYHRNLKIRFQLADKYYQRVPKYKKDLLKMDFKLQRNYSDYNPLDWNYFTEGLRPAP